MTERARYQHAGWTVELTSYEVQQGLNNPAGWVPQVTLTRTVGGTWEHQPISLGPDHIKPTKKEADVVAARLAVQWIDENG